MKNDILPYDLWIEEALRQVVLRALRITVTEGLPGDHHFYITFHTNNGNVNIPPWMLEKYPEKMTIIIRNWFDNLKVRSNYFEITLNFSNQPERLTVPFEELLFVSKTFLSYLT